MESKKKPTPTYTTEFRERGVRLYREHRPDYTSDNAAYMDARVLGHEHLITGTSRCQEEKSPGGSRSRLGSRLIHVQSQKMTAAARAMADRKTLGHLS